MVEGIQSESLGLFCPELTNPLERREAPKALEPLRKVVRIEEGGHMRSKARMRGVEEPADGGLLDGAIHPFDLTVGPRMVEFREPMVDTVLGARVVKGVRPKALMGREHFPKLANTPAATWLRELKAVVPSEQRSRQDKCFSRMGLPQLNPEETASHDLTFFYHVANGAGSD